jgi:hypothetical protein
MWVSEKSSALGLSAFLGINFYCGQRMYRIPVLMLCLSPEHLYNLPTSTICSRALQASGSPNFCKPTPNCSSANLAHLKEGSSILPGFPLESFLTPQPCFPTLHQWPTKHSFPDSSAHTTPCPVIA